VRERAAKFGFLLFGVHRCVCFGMSHKCTEVLEFNVFYPRDAQHSAVFATATWLAVWLAGCLSHAGIVSKRLKLS